MGIFTLQGRVRTEVTCVISLYADRLTIVTMYVGGNTPSNVNEDITLLAKVVSSHYKKRTSSTAAKNIASDKPAHLFGTTYLQHEKSEKAHCSYSNGP